ncbi:3851_t:CDS:1, partial [Rhizophagus irregularis]
NVENVEESLSGSSKLASSTKISKRLSFLESTASSQQQKMKIFFVKRNSKIY